MDENEVTATVLWPDDPTERTITTSTGHGLLFDGYCRDHDSYECVENLTAEEQQAINHATEAGK